MSRQGDRGDVSIEAAVLEFVLARHPAQLTLAELVREIGEGSDGDRAGVDRAVLALVDSGLLSRQGELVLPTDPALRFDQLLGG
jgi:DNA-binding IclR family transcriptional regulator